MQKVENREQFFDTTLENELISTFICNEKAREELFDLSEDIYYLEKNKRLWNVLKAMWMDNEKIEVSTLYIHLKKHIGDYGGITGLTELATSYNNQEAYKQIAEKLKEYRARRELYKMNVDIQKAFVDEIDNKEIINKTQEKLDKINNDGIEEDEGDIFDDLNDILVVIDKKLKGEYVNNGVMTGFTGLDNKLHGLNKKELYIVGGRPGSGKTTLVNSIALNIAKNKKYVALFNLEMSKSQIVLKLLANVGMIDMDKLITGELSDSDKNNKEYAAAKLYEISNHLKIFDDVFTLDKIIIKARKLKKQNKLDLLIIDYLQLIEGNKGNNRQEEISNISRKLKMLGSELDIPIIALSQLSRTCETRADHRPILSDLRESGSIEQDASVVMFTYRDEYYNKDTEDKNVMEVITGKNRNGKVGTEKLAWIGKYQKVANASFLK